MFWLGFFVVDAAEGSDSCAIVDRIGGFVLPLCVGHALRQRCTTLDDAAGWFLGFWSSENSVNLGVQTNTSPFAHFFSLAPTLPTVEHCHVQHAHGSVCASSKHCHYLVTSTARPFCSTSPTFIPTPTTRNSSTTKLTGTRCPVSATPRWIDSLALWADPMHVTLGNALLNRCQIAERTG